MAAVGLAREALSPITRPEHAVIFLVEAILGFGVHGFSSTAESKAQFAERAFHRQPEPIQTAIRKDWLFDHLPFYAAMVDLSLSEFERELAERFWSDVEREATENPSRKRQKEAKHDLEVRNVRGPVHARLR